MLETRVNVDFIHDSKYLSFAIRGRLIQSITDWNAIIRVG